MPATAVLRVVPRPIAGMARSYNSRGVRRGAGALRRT